MLKFRHLLERHGLTRQRLDQVNSVLSRKQLLMREGTVVDATIIATPAATPVL